MDPQSSANQQTVITCGTRIERGRNCCTLANPRPAFSKTDRTTSASANLGTACRAPTAPLRPGATTRAPAPIFRGTRVVHAPLACRSVQSSV